MSNERCIIVGWFIKTDDNSFKEYCLYNDIDYRQSYHSKKYYILGDCIQYSREYYEENFVELDIKKIKEMEITSDVIFGNIPNIDLSTKKFGILDWREW